MQTANISKENQKKIAKKKSYIQIKTTKKYLKKKYKLSSGYQIHYEIKTILNPN
ncbi:hypothetical protein NEICINOT_04607 [Neisseria cinerea ATCC 14685]|uniref:Uncharacterized protein n=1 Tax=Neisseria cinerea ATCC 14685 TaxID=546262 RepID=D0W4K9_NEICI|nr:hypothetical protein NEICINOT_04607 [Neisseria cinerea ATCC 14685]